ncbi:MAG TPA: MgtC/SapB family protein [Terriglobia bacterium]|nr:MgtC/SapB family protein [Terriglobia bacterium]
MMPQNPLLAIDAVVKFPATQVAETIAIAVGIGLAIGLEREWAHKEIGVRTFAITALMGALSSLLGVGFAIAAFAGVFILIACVNARNLAMSRNVETTTSATLMVTLLLGVLAGQSHYFTAITSAVLVTMLLAWKTELTRFAVGLNPDEIRSAVFIGLIAFVAYPILPDRFVDRWQLINPREIWFVVTVVAGIGFANYILLRLYGAKGLYYTALLGGLVNSTATVVELSPVLATAAEGASGFGQAVVLVTSVAMFTRNLAIVAIFALPAFRQALWPLASMAAFAALVAWIRHGKTRPPSELHLSSPLSLRRVMTFGALFILIEIVGKLAERYLGDLGFLALSFVGGLASSASTAAAAATMTARHQLKAEVAGVAVVLCSISSSLIDLPLIYQQTRNKRLTATLVAFSSFMVLIGVGILLLTLFWRR